MEQMTLVVAGIAALAILLIAVGIAIVGGQLGHQHASRALRLRQARQGRQGGLDRAGSDLATSSPRARRSPTSTRSSSSATSGRTWRATSPGPTSSSSRASSCSSGARRSSASRVAMLLLSVVFPALRSPLAPAHRGAHRRPGCRASGSAAARTAGSTPSTSSCPDTITLIANALRAGSSFLQAIELVVRESRPPISTEFGRVIREVNLGLPFDQALENMVRRVRSDDLELMATAISIQHTGRRQPRRDPRLDRVHDPRAGPDQGRDPDADRPAAAVGLRRRLPADRPGGLPVHRRPELHGADVRQQRGDRRLARRRHHPGVRRVHDVHRLHGHPPDRRHRGLTP